MSKYNLFKDRSRFSEIYKQTDEERKITDVKREKYRQIERARAEEEEQQRMQRLASQQEKSISQHGKMPTLWFYIIVLRYEET